MIKTFFLFITFFIYTKLRPLSCAFRWVLKCTACGKITPEVGRIFCPKCGNGGTLYKVSVTVGANGTLHAGRIRRVNLRGTRVCSSAPPFSEKTVPNRYRSE